MDIFNLTPFHFANLVGRMPFPGHSLTLIVKATFNLVPDDVVSISEEQLFPTGDENLDPEADVESSVFYPSDFAYFKPKGDIVLIGSAYAPNASPVQQLRVGLKVGTLSKVLNVHGNRMLKTTIIAGTQPGDAESFTKMPICYENVFGGEGFPKNPVGKGKDRIQYPNIEYQHDPVTNLNASYRPAGFGPVSTTWSPRREKVGTYTNRYVDERWPWFPTDFDFGFYNVAPLDQQVEGYLNGDEEIVLENLHPELPLLSTRLPGMRVRMFLRTFDDKTESGIDPFSEIPLNLDTLWLCPDQNKLVLVWRGVATVESEDFEEIQHAFISAEPLETPLSISEHQNEYEKLLSEIDAEWEEEAPPADVMESAIAPDEATTEKHKPPVDPGAEILSKFIAEHKAKCEESGIDPDAPPVLSKEQEKERQRILDEIEVQQAEMDKEAETKLTREDVILRIENGEPLVGEDLSGLDLTNLNLSGTDLSEANLSGADLRSVDATSAIFDRADLTAALLGRANLAGASFEAADLTLTNITNADMSAAKLNDANLPECHLENTIVSGLVAQNAVFANARFTNIDFDSTDLSGATFSDTSWTDCKIRQSNILETDFTRAAFSSMTVDEVECEGVIFNQASLKSCVFRKLKGEYASFEKSSLEEAQFIDCELDKADFSNANLTNARLMSASLKEASFTEAIAPGINMSFAKVFELRASAADFSGGCFSHIEGFESIWDKATLNDTDFSFGELEGADFSSALLVNADFTSANLKFSTFAKSTCLGSKFGTSNLFEATLTRADFEDADLGGANMYGAEVMDANFRNAKLINANVKMSKLAKK